MSTTSTTPFPSFKNSYFQAKAWCKIFLVKMSLNRMRIKNYFHINSFAISLALKQRLGTSFDVLVSHLRTRFSFSSCQIEIWRVFTLLASRMTIISWKLFILSLFLEQQRKNRLPQESRETDDEISVACSGGCSCWPGILRDFCLYLRPIHEDR